MKKVTLLIAMLLFATTAFAQARAPQFTSGVTVQGTPVVAVAGNSVQFDQAAPDLATAQSYTYQLYIDGSGTPVVGPGSTCTGTASPFACSVKLPASLSPGSHSVTATAKDAVAGESAQSLPLAFTFAVTPGAPANLRIIKGS